MPFEHARLWLSRDNGGDVSHCVELQAQTGPSQHQPHSVKKPKQSRSKCRDALDLMGTFVYV